MSKANKALSTILLSMLSSIALVAIKASAGFWGNSYALVADAIESSTDVFSSLLIYLGLRYTQKPADQNHPYGHGKAEPLITFWVVGFLMITASLIAFKSIEMIQTPHELPAPWTLILLALIVLWKEISFRLVMRKSKETNSAALQADAWHHRSDAITSVAAFVGISIALWMGKGYESADDWAALLATGFIFYNSYLIFKPAFSEIMDEHAYPELEKEIRLVSLEVRGILAIEKCFIRKSGMQFHIDLHAQVESTITVKEGHDVAHQLQNHIQNKLENVGNVHIHIEPWSPKENNHQ